MGVVGNTLANFSDILNDSKKITLWFTLKLKMLFFSTKREREREAGQDSVNEV